MFSLLMGGAPNRAAQLHNVSPGLSNLSFGLGDTFPVKHSLQCMPSGANVFFAVYIGLIIVAAAFVQTLGTFLGLLPSATVFLLLLCNVKAAIGPGVNSKMLNWFAAAIIPVLVMLSVILTTAVLFPDMSDAHSNWFLLLPEMRSNCMFIRESSEFW
jgi:hypothetical protein